MKKIISLFISLLTFIFIYPISATAQEKIYPDTSDDLILHNSSTYIIGDVNNDSELNVSDLVTMLLYLHGSSEYKPTTNYSNKLNYLDVNLDGNADIFDLVELRKAVIAPETAFKQISSVDILATADRAEIKSTFISSPGELTAYLENIGTDDEEIQKYLGIYDGDFFKKSDVILGTLEQEFGEGIHFRAPVCDYIQGKFLDIAESETFCEYYELDPEIVRKSAIYCLYTCQEYKSHPMVYNKEKNIILFQVTVPKTVRETTNGICVLFDFELFTPDYYAHQYDSPDGKHKLYITVAEDHFMDDTCQYMFYEIENDGSYAYLGEYYDGYAYYGDAFKREYTKTNEGQYAAYFFDDFCKIIWKGTGFDIQIKTYVFNENIDEWVLSWKSILTDND
ncbi:dockerin type I domain-containing protein [Ruminococcus sp.]|uniref:dockerin type I domain-containing protein n=1 Tax=Ruminococcus sp. TaxID=41978 RepID=UPI0025DEC2D5|nr:dockerin type I domain-containing protein [Ruminococcus sp.]